MFIERRHTGAGVDQHQRDIRLRDRLLRLLSHPSLETVIERVLQPRGIDNAKRKVADTAHPLAPVARDTGRVINQSQPLSDKPVEKSRLAHIGAADNRDSEGHGNSRSASSHRDEITVLGQKVKRTIGDHWRQEYLLRKIDPPQYFTRIR